MTIQTLTSNAPSGLPDELTLARLAGEFFAALPSGAAPSPSAATQNFGGSWPTPHVPAQGAPLPSAPAAIEVNSAPSPTASPESPAELDIGRTPLFGIGADYAPSLPSVTPPVAAPAAPVSPPSSPYYFLGESSAYPSAASVALPEDRISAQSFGLPGEDTLRQLLGGIPSERRESAAAPSSSGGYYFLDSAKPALPAESGRRVFDVEAVRRDFPILAERVNGKPLVWFDNAATTHKPQAVIDRLAYFYAHENSNIHRAAHELAARATDAYEGARNKVARFIGASSTEEIIFVRGATEAINLVAQSWGRQNIREGDEIVISILEHHANIVPWQMLAAEKGAKLRVIPVDDSGQILLEEYRKLLNDRTKLVAVTQVSNALGTVTPIKEIVDLAHRAGAKALVDGAQSVSHLRVNVQALDADFFVFSGHKVFAPTGIGVVYGKKAILDSMPPWQGGGNMISDVTFERTLYHGAPSRFEAGTGNIADAVGLGAALDYVDRLGLENIARYEHDLLVYASEGLRSIPGVRLIGTAKDKASVASFVLAGYSTQDVGVALNKEGIAVRTGHHCAQPILRRFGLETTVRPSLAFYNTCEEVDRMLKVVRQLARK
ncbi:MAG: cysteine desulfurase [Nitrosomonadales bacterium]|nr:cysteine desulfurase [Nitrosomonadales bacterium]